MDEVSSVYLELSNVNARHSREVAADRAEVAAMRALHKRARAQLEEEQAQAVADRAAATSALRARHEVERGVLLVRRSEALEAAASKPKRRPGRPYTGGKGGISLGDFPIDKQIVEFFVKGWTLTPKLQAAASAMTDAEKEAIWQAVRAQRLPGEQG